MHGGSSQTPLCKGGVWEASSVTAPQCWSSLTAQREEARKTFSCSLSELKEGLFQSPPPPSPPPTTLLTNQLCLPSISLFSSFHHALKWAAAFFWPLAPLRSHYISLSSSLKWQQRSSISTQCHLSLLSTVFHLQLNKLHPLPLISGVLCGS